MPGRALTAAFASALLALGCGGREPVRAPEPAAAAVLPSPAAPSPAPRAGRLERPSARRGDRHARAAARRAPQVKRADGVVARASDRQVVIRRRGAPELTLRVGRGTVVTVDGVPTRAAALRAGAPVRAAYDAGAGGRPAALRVESNAAAAPPGGS